jgi:hypothetical protein
MNKIKLVTTAVKNPISWAYWAYQEGGYEGFDHGQIFFKKKKKKRNRPRRETQESFLTSFIDPIMTSSEQGATKKKRKTSFTSAFKAYSLIALTAACIPTHVHTHITEPADRRAGMLRTIEKRKTKKKKKEKKETKKISPAQYSSSCSERFPGYSWLEPV